MILATKFGLLIDDEGRLAGGSRRYVLSAVEASLKRLKSRSFERQHHLVNKVRRVIWRGPPHRCTLDFIENECQPDGRHC